MPKITLLSKLFIDVKDKLPEFEQEVLLHSLIPASPPSTGIVSHYDFGTLMSVNMTQKGKEVTFKSREGKDLKAVSHWLYLASPSKEKESVKEESTTGK